MLLLLMSVAIAVLVVVVIVQAVVVVVVANVVIVFVFGCCCSCQLHIRNTQIVFLTVTLEQMKHGCNPFAVSQILREWLLPCFAKGNYV